VTPLSWTFKLIPTFTTLNTEIRDKLLFFKTLVDDSANLALPARTTLTLATDACTPTQNAHAIDTEAAAATDDLSTLTIAGNIRAGHLLILTAANSARVPTVRSGIGNILMAGGDYGLDGSKNAFLLLQLVGTTWFEITRAVYNSGGTNRAETGTGNITAMALPAGPGPLTIYMNNASLATIQGIAAGLVGQTLTIHSVNAEVRLAHQDASGTALGKLLNFATSGPSALAPGAGSAVYEYDTSLRWRLVQHEQGAPISLVGNYSTTNITATGGSASLTPVAPAQCTYYLKGRMLHWHFQMSGATLAAGPATTIQLKSPGPTVGGVAGAGYQCLLQDFYPAVIRGLDNGTTVLGMFETNAGSQSVQCRTGFLGGGWANSASLNIEFSVSYPIV
jgi:hypothetical protein